MKNKVKKAICDYKMLSGGERLTVGLSGGADSVCLLLCLLELREEFNLEITACHINHCLRGDDSDADEAFCRKLCETLCLPLYVFRDDIGKIAGERKIGLEQCGRQIRYERFKEISNITATAHNACDNAETVLLNLVRGASLTGMTGIPAVNEKKGHRIIRPLIYCTRQEIEEYLKEKNQNYVTDASNFEPIYNRNLIRLSVMPKLREINPSFENAVLRMNESVREDAEFLDSLCDEAIKKAKLSDERYNSDVLSSVARPVLSRACAKLLWAHEIDPTREKIGYISDAVNNHEKHAIGGGWYADGKSSELVFYRDDDFSDFEYPLSIGNLSLPKGKTVKLSVISRKEFDEMFKSGRKYLYHTLDYDKILSKAVVRNRRDGDTVKLHGRNFTNKIKKLFSEHIPLEKRDSVVLIADSGGVVFVEGFGTATRTEVTEETENILYIDIKE